MRRGIAGLLLILGFAAANMYVEPREPDYWKRVLVVDVREAGTDCPLPGALVRVSGVKKTTLTDSHGRARFPARVTLSQEVSASCSGYETGADKPQLVSADTVKVCLELMPISPRAVLDTTGVANYNRWVLANRDTLPGLQPAWVSVPGPIPWPADSYPAQYVRFWGEDGSVRGSLKLDDFGVGVNVAGPYVVASYGNMSCLVYDSSGRRYLRETPDSTVVWSPEGKLRFPGCYQPSLGNPTILVRQDHYVAVGDTILFLDRDGALINKVVREPQFNTSDADVYQSPSGTSVVAESDLVAYDRKGNVLWRKSRGGREPIYLSADGSTFARVIRVLARLALMAYDRSGATIAWIGITDQPEVVRLSANGQFAALYGGRTATLVSITGQKVLWQVTFGDSTEGGEPKILDVRPNAMVIAFSSFHRDQLFYDAHMLVDGHEMDKPIRVRREPGSLWQCSVAGDLLVARLGDRFHVYTLWR